MRHLEDEDIARMIEGKISKKERKNFLKHFSECDSCLTVYSDTFKFIEKEKKRPTMLKLPFIEKIKIPAQKLWKGIRVLFSNRIFRPAFAVLIIILIIMPLVLKELHYKKIQDAKIQQIARSIENLEIHAFSPAKDEIYAAIRAGIFIKDMSVLVTTASEEKLRQKIAKILNNELKAIFKNETEPLPDPENIDRNTVKRIISRIELHPLSQLFRFGRFLEHSILSCIENKIPGNEDIHEYQRVLMEYKDKLPIGVFKKLEKLNSNTEVKKSKKILEDLKEILLSSG